jgi:hypothetical protein
MSICRSSSIWSDGASSRGDGIRRYWRRYWRMPLSYRASICAYATCLRSPCCSRAPLSQIVVVVVVVILSIVVVFQSPCPVASSTRNRDDSGITAVADLVTPHAILPEWRSLTTDSSFISMQSTS